MVSLQEQETLQLRALKLLTPIKGTFPLYTLPLRARITQKMFPIQDVLRMFLINGHQGCFLILP